MTELTDHIRDNQELSDAIYTVIARLASHHFALRTALGHEMLGTIPGLRMTDYECRDLCRVAAMILRHLPEPKPAPENGNPNGQ